MPPSESFSFFEAGPPRQTIALRRLVDDGRECMLSGSPIRLGRLLFSPDSRWLIDVGLSEIEYGGWRTDSKVIRYYSSLERRSELKATIIFQSMASS